MIAWKVGDVFDPLIDKCTKIVYVLDEAVALSDLASARDPRRTDRWIHVRGCAEQVDC